MSATRVFSQVSATRVFPQMSATRGVEAGPFRFLVEIKLRPIGRIVRYQGWLTPGS